MQLVSVHFDGSCIANTPLDGRLWLVPAGFSALKVNDSEVVLQLEPGEHGVDIPVGNLPLVFIAEDFQVKVENLLISPPPPFSMSDIERMWDDVIGSEIRPIKGPVIGQGSVLDEINLRKYGLSLSEVAQAIMSTRQLLTQWPVVHSRARRWVPIGRRGGVEEVSVTERSAKASVGGYVDGRLVPERSARRIVEPGLWKSKDLSVACGQLFDLVRGANSVGVGPEVCLAEASARAAPRSRNRDEPVSSWPSVARRAYIDVVRALFVASSGGDATGPVPLCRVWELYESWVASQVLKQLSSELGDWSQGSCQWWSCWWGSAASGIGFHVQPAIGQKKVSQAVGRPGIQSVSSMLVPDIMVSRWSDGLVGDLTFIDAKFRRPHTSMKSGDVAEALSKYLWGVRIADEGSSFPQSRALIASPVPSGSMFMRNKSQISSVRFHPYSSIPNPLKGPALTREGVETVSETKLR